MPVISDKLNRWLLVVAAIFLLPNAFYWTSRGYYGLFDFANVFGDQYSSILISAYLLIFFAIASRNLRFRAVLTYASVILNLYYWFHLADAMRGSGASLLTLLRTLFFGTPGHAPLAASQTIGVVLLVFLCYNQLEKFVTFFLVLRAFISDTAHRLHTAIWAVLTALSVAGLVVVFGFYIWDNWWNDNGFANNATMAMLALLSLLVLLALDLLVWSVILWASIYWVSHIQQLVDDLRDFHINQYITRKLGGYIYTAYSVAIVGIAAIAIPASAFGEFVPRAEYGTSPVDWLIFPIYFIGGIAVTFLVLIVWRIIVEFTVSLIHIAENTRKN